jgi:hypothetical protein
MLGEQGEGERGKKLDLADDAIAPGVLAFSTGAATNGELLEPHGIAPLEDLGIGDGGVGHVGL